MLSKFKQTTALTEALVELCAFHAPIIEYQDGATIHNRGDFKPGLSIVYSGQVKMGNFGLDGIYHHTVTLQRADTFGEFTLFNNLPRTHHAQALGTTEVVQMSAQRFERFVKTHPELQTVLLRSMSLKLHLALELLDDLSRLPTYIRLAKLLQEYADETGKVSLKQKELSELLGVSALSAHKAVKKLCALALVKSAYGAVVIIEKQRFDDWLEQQLSLGKLVNA